MQFNTQLRHLFTLPISNDNTIHLNDQRTHSTNVHATTSCVHSFRLKDATRPGMYIVVSVRHLDIRFRITLISVLQFYPEPNKIQDPDLPTSLHRSPAVTLLENQNSTYNYHSTRVPAAPVLLKTQPIYIYTHTHIKDEHEHGHLLLYTYLGLWVLKLNVAQAHINENTG